MFTRDGYRCTLCGKAGRLHAHHVRPLHLHPDQDPYDPAGSVTYCRSCHIDHHRRPVSPEALAWRALVAELRPETVRRATRTSCPKVIAHLKESIGNVVSFPAVVSIELLYS